MSEKPKPVDVETHVQPILQKLRVHGSFTGYVLLDRDEALGLAQYVDASARQIDQFVREAEQREEKRNTYLLCIALLLFFIAMGYFWS